MTNVPGFNIHPNRLSFTQKVTLNAYTYRAKPASHLVMNAPEFAADMRARFPATDIILRQLPAGGRTDNDIYDLETPQQFINRHKSILSSVGRDDLIIYAGNEPIPPHGAKQMEWNLQVGRLAVASGMRVVLLNAPTGNLPQSPEQTSLFHYYEELLRLSSDNPDSVYIGEHNYGPPLWRSWTPWLFGRYRFLHDYYAARGINAAWQITEFGYDTRHGRDDGETWDLQRAIEWHIRTGQLNGREPEVATAHTLYDIWLNVYANRKEVKGLHDFVFGNDGSTVPDAADNWERFNAANHPLFVNTLATLFETYNGTTPEPPTQPDDTQPSEPIEIPDEPEPPQAPGTLCAALKWLLRRFCEDCE